MTMTEKVLETLVYSPFNPLTQLLAREYFTEQYYCYHSFLWNYVLTISPWQEPGDILFCHNRVNHGHVKLAVSKILKDTTLQFLHWLQDDTTALRTNLLGWEQPILWSNFPFSLGYMMWPLQSVSPPPPPIRQSKRFKFFYCSGNCWSELLMLNYF
jgi:hypothetical protein